MLDYLIVGQGIAGTLLSWFLQHDGKRFHVIDHHKPNAASYMAGAILNPVTGRKMIKSWKVDELIPFAAKVYHQMEQELDDDDLVREIPICKFFANEADQQFFQKAKERGTAMPFMDELEADYSRYFNHELGGVIISGTWQVKPWRVVAAWRYHLEQQQLLTNEAFDHDALVVGEESVQYKGLQAKQIIFAEGPGLLQNPWFNWLPLRPAKGERMVIKVAGLPDEYMWKRTIYLIPLGNEEFYVGSTNAWQWNDDGPSEWGYEELTTKLDKVLKLPYDIISHQGAVRPNAKDRRPFIGRHPEQERVAVFNGFGTKGVSQTPLLARKFIDHLEDGQPLWEEVKIARYYKK